MSPLDSLPANNCKGYKMNLKRMVAVWAALTSALSAWMLPYDIKKRGNIDPAEDGKYLAESATYMAVPLVVYEIILRMVRNRGRRELPVAEAVAAAATCGIIARIFIKPSEITRQEDLNFVSVTMGLVSFVPIGLYALMRRSEQ